MRLCLALSLATAAALVIPSYALAEPPASLVMSADSVRYYSDRFVVTGDGHVHVRLSDGTTLTGSTFAMDLKLNRYIVAGKVDLTSSAVHEAGAAFSGFLDVDRSYFLPANTTPDRWTFSGSDFAHPAKGREQPGDTFALPDVSDERPFILSSRASIIPKTNIQLADARVLAAGVYAPTHSFVVTFSANPNFSQNAFAGADLDIGVPYQASAHALSAFHLRYDSLNKAYLSFDQHFVWDRDWIAFSVNPLTREQRQFNLIAYDRIARKLEARLFLQETTSQHGIYRPEIASSFENIQAVAGLPHSSINVNFNQYNTSLLCCSTYIQQNDHPSDFTLNWIGFDHQLGKIPLTYRLRSGLENSHDGYQAGLNLPGPPPGGLYLLDFAGTPVTTIFQKYVGLTLYSSSLRVSNNTYFNATFDKQRQWFSLPHHVDTTNVTLSLSRLYGTKLALLAAYANTNIGDFYGARQAEFYPPYGTVITPLGAYPGYNAFFGFATTRSLTGSAVFTPNAYFNVTLTLRHDKDYPDPVPDLFGVTPWQITTEFRVRLARQVLLDVSRAYYFNFGDRRWQPQFSIQFGP